MLLDSSTTRTRRRTKESREGSLRATSCPLWLKVVRQLRRSAYFGLLVSLGGGVDAGAGMELVGGTGSAVAGEVCDVGAVD